MKKLTTLLLILSCTLLMACNKGHEINGQNMKTAYRSIKGLKNRLPAENRIEFEVSFWTLRDAIKNEGDFLNAVDGKTPEEIIVLGKEIYQQRKNSGFQGYAQYSSWEEMITKFGRERMDQDTRKSKPKETPKDKTNDLLYKL
jgi:hypothetical protein